MMGWQNVASLPGVNAISRVAEVFHVYVDGGPEDLVIEVSEEASGQYVGVCNYERWGPEQGGPYRSISPTDSMDGALQAAMRGVRMHHRSKHPPEVVFWVRNPLPGEGFEKIYVDGNGITVDRETVDERRKQYLDRGQEKPSARA